MSSPSPTFSKSNHARAQPPSSQPTEIGSGLACGEESTAPPGSLSREPALKPPSYSPSSGSAQLQAPHASVAHDELHSARPWSQITASGGAADDGAGVGAVALFAALSRARRDSKFTPPLDGFGMR